MIKMQFNARFVLDDSNPDRPFFKLDLFTDNITNNAELLTSLRDQIPTINIQHPLFGEHRLNDYLEPAKNTFGEQKPHIAVGWFGGFHQRNPALLKAEHNGLAPRDPSMPLDEEVISNAKALVGANVFTLEFDVALDSFAVVSSYLKADELPNVTNFAAVRSFAGGERDLTLGWNLSESSSLLITEKAKSVFGQDFKQTGFGGKEVPFYFTIAQASIERAFSPAPAITPMKDIHSSVDATPNASDTITTNASQITKEEKKTQSLTM